MIDIVDTFKETHTWQYILFVHPISEDGQCHAQALLQLCPELTIDFWVDITEYDEEDRMRMKQFLDERDLYYSVESFLRPCDD